LAVECAADTPPACVINESTAAESLANVDVGSDFHGQADLFELGSNPGIHKVCALFVVVWFLTVIRLVHTGQSLANVDVGGDFHGEADLFKLGRDPSIHN
jgi:hypothetical protein